MAQSFKDKAIASLILFGILLAIIGSIIILIHWETPEKRKDGRWFLIGAGIAWLIAIKINSITMKRLRFAAVRKFK